MGNSELTPISPESEPHIIIGKDRIIRVPDELKHLAVQYEHNVTSVTFDCPRYSDGIDLLDLMLYVNYYRQDNTPGSYAVTDAKVSEKDPNIISFTWVIKKHVAAVSGRIQFLICAKNVDENGELVNRYSTKICKDCRILKGFDTNDEILDSQPDLVTQILLKMDNTVNYVPHISEDGILSWTNDGNKPNPEPISIIGPKGDPGEPGPVTRSVLLKDTSTQKEYSLIVTDGKLYMAEANS